MFAKQNARASSKGSERKEHQAITDGLSSVGNRAHRRAPSSARSSLRVDIFGPHAVQKVSQIILGEILFNLYFL